MISLLVIFLFLPNIILTSVPFSINPNCNEDQCKRLNNPALFYANKTIGDENIHMIYSSFDDLTITIFSTDKNAYPIFNYSALFSQNYRNAIQFNGGKPSNSFTFILRRLIQFNDEKDTGILNDQLITDVFPIRNLLTTNLTFQTNQTEQPTFQFPLNKLNGSLNIDVVFPGEKKRDKKFPKLQTDSKSFYINIALKATNYFQSKTRFAFEIYLITPSAQGFQSHSSKFIDDHYTPGIFNVYQMKSIGDLYPSSMLWKPAVYLSEERTIEQNTLMKIYSINNNLTYNSTDERGIFYSIIPVPIMSGINVSLGQANDGFFTKTNYSFIQFNAGLDILQPDSTKVFVTVALIISLALPLIVGIIALIFFLKRKFSKENSDSYKVLHN